jgi:hypothetical protein
MEMYWVNISAKFDNDRNRIQDGRLVASFVEAEKVLLLLN